MRATVVVPWRGGCPAREAAFDWVRARWASRYPEWPLVAAEGQSPDGTWVKADAVMPAIETCESELVIIADADVWCDGIDAAVAAVARDRAAWALPHSHVFRLSASATADVLRGLEPSTNTELAEPPHRGQRGGGIVVARRETLLEVPLDPRFVGWGQEDASWGTALLILAGAMWRGPYPLYHLWHPSQRRVERRWGSRASKSLHARYAAARNDPARMRALLAEFQEA